MPPRRGRATRVRSGRRDESSDNEEEVPLPAPPRPFNNVEGLPLSVDEPEYNLLNSPLSLRDSAVLYSSLMKSRRAYVNGNIFDLFWAKGKTKFDDDSNARDRMNKLTDGGLEIGPHSFDVRFFILKDDEIERKREEEKAQKKEKRLANKKLREEKKKLRELKTTDTNNGQSESRKIVNEIDPEKNPEANVDDDDSSSEEEDDADEQTSNANHDDSRSPENPPETTKPNPDSVEELNENTEEQPEEQPGEKSKEDQMTSESTDVSQATKELRNSTEQKVVETPRPSPKSLTKPLPPLQVQSVPLKQAPTPKHPPKAQQASTSTASSSAADPMQTPESQMMIANLNAIARVDTSLNALMKIVATGNATPEQIREFQGYIQKAKAMGPSQQFKQQFPEFASNSNTKVPKVKPPKPPKPPKKAKPPRETQLTTFQELYVNGADLVFEFSENPNVRYHLPKECIIEKTGSNELLVSFLVVHNREQIKRFRDRQNAKKQKLENREKELEQSATTEPVSVSETQRDQVEVEVEGEVEEESKEESKEDDLSTTRPKRGRPKNAENKVKEEPSIDLKDLKEEPIPYFSALSFKISSIAPKYDPIFTNSFKKHEEVKEKMEVILEKGIRVPKSFVWYSVDAFEDEELAEGLRHQLYLIENPPKGKYKKRSIEDNLILNKPGKPTSKRVKTE